LVVFVTARPQWGGVIAWAIECQQDSQGRPVAGQININPSLFGQSTQLKAILMHELTHILVFSPNLYSSYKNQNGQSYSSVTNSVTKTCNYIINIS
jgi:hypothetical protein